MTFDGAALVERPARLREDRGFQGLTVKMDAYCLARVDGAGPSEAWRAAYNAERCSPETVAAHAQKLEQDARINLRIRQLRTQKEASTILAPIPDKNFVMTRLARLADGAKKESDQLKALELLGKTAEIDLFREHTIVERRERSPDEVRKELLARLSQLRPMIEGEAHEVSPPGLQPEAPRVARKRKPIQP